VTYQRVATFSGLVEEGRKTGAELRYQSGKSFWKVVYFDPKQLRARIAELKLMEENVSEELKALAALEASTPKPRFPILSP